MGYSYNQALVVVLLSGKLKEIKPLTLIVALIFVVRYAFVSM